MSRLVFLSIANWVHLVATVVWMGGMTSNLLVLLPTARKTLEPAAMGALMAGVMKRFRILTYASILLLAASGVLMGSSNPAYLGPLNFGNLWSVITSLKHIVVAALVVLAVYAYEGVARRVSRLAAQGPSKELGLLQKRQMAIAFSGLILALVVLFLTAMMTALSATT